MTIKKVLFVSSALIMLATVMLIISLIIANKGVQSTREAQQVKTHSLSLANELKESSRGLTAAVQKFTVTGNERYADEYMDIVMIRSGEKPRPEDREIAPGQRIALNELMKQAQFSDEELYLLQQSSELSDRLIGLEVRAMNAVRGLYPDSEGHYTVSGPPDQELAISLIFSEAYEKEVALIMEPFVQFDTMLNNRLNDAVIAARHNYDRGIQIVWIIFGVLVTMFTAVLIMVGLLIVRPILLCDAFAKQVTEGHFDNRLDYTSGNEIGSLAASLRAMVQSLVGRIELEEHARYFDAVITMADAGVIVLDQNHLITDWNVGAETIFGFTAEEMIGKTRKFYAAKEVYAKIDDLEARLERGESFARADVERINKNGSLIICSASYTPIFDNKGNFTGSVAIFHDVTENKHMETALKKAMLEIEEKHKIIMASINYSSKIQKNLLPNKAVLKRAFSDHAVIWDPRDIVGGDIYWVKNFDDGSVLCVCDCTGHGIPGALLTMLVVSAFESIINESNYKDTAQILWLLEQRLTHVLNASYHSQRTNNIKDGCDPAILFVSQSGEVTISSGNTSVFVCDGEEVRRIKGQRLYVGEGKINRKEDIQTVKIPANPNNKFYIATDGFFDQIGGHAIVPIGHKRFMDLMLKHHDKKLSDISDIFWQTFEEYQGEEERRDDVELIAFSA